jgi:hypothetical protein
MPELHLTLSHSTLVLLAAVFTAGALSYFLYRLTVPPIPRALRLTLSALRFFSLLLLVLIIGEPLLSLVTRSSEDPVVMVLVDNSRSMAIRDEAGDRRETTIRVAETLNRQRLRAGEFRFVLFDNRVHPLAGFSRDSMTFAGSGTDIVNALHSVKKSLSAANIQTVVLLSDGNSTTGTNPLYEAMELGIPVFTIGIGDTSEQKDILIRKAVTNTVTYVGNRVPVQATVRSTGYEDRRVEVTLSDEKDVLDRKILTLNREVREYGMTFHFVPQTDGMQKLTVAVSELPGELTVHNNRFSLFTRVLKSKMKVLMIAGSPSADVAFIRRTLENDPNIELTSRIERKGGQFYEGALTPQLLTEAECLVLLGFPTPTSSLQTISAVLQASSAGKGIFILLSRTIDLQRLRMLDQLLPVTSASHQATPLQEYQVFLSLEGSKLTHPILKLSEQNAAELWARMPPIFALQTQFISKPESDVLAYTRVQSQTLSDPLLVTRSIGGHKTVALLGYGLWRWKMLSDEQTQPVLDQFLSSTVRWLTTREDERPIRVKTSREQFTTQESIDFSAQVYDENYQPIENARVRVAIQQGGRTYEVYLDPLGNGQYEGSLDGLGEGDYKFAATVTLDGRTIGEDRGRFTVGGVHAEFIETRMNKSLLEQIATRTGARYYDPPSVAALIAEIASLPNFQPRIRTTANEFQLWNSPWTLGILVFLLSLEWFLRKRHGML